MSRLRGFAAALAVGGVILALGYAVPRIGQDGGDDATGDGDVSGVVLACVPALETACESAAGVLGVPTARWRPGEAVPGRSVVVAPSGSVEDGPVVAASPIVIGAWRDRSQVLLASCGSLDIACIGDVLGEEWQDIGGDDAWGDVKIGLADPASGVEGLAAWALLVDSGIGDLAGALRLVADGDAELVSDLVLFGDSRADLVVTTEVALAGQLENAIGRGGRLEIFYPDSSPWIEYVASGTGFGSSGLVDRLGEPEAAAAFAAAGLRPATGTYPLPDALGEPGGRRPLPSPEDRARLLEAWER